jgi:predicted nuclease of predicted toxin-antitoxin system
VKLLFDHNLSYKLAARLADQFPGSMQVRMLELDKVDDLTVWRFAVTHGYTIVTLDSDYSDLSILRGSPPKVVWLRCGNSTVNQVENLLREHLESIKSLAEPNSADCLEIWP